MSGSDIAIAGGGLIGLASACLLARRGLKIDVIESADPVTWDPGQISSRVSAINIATHRLLQSVGVWENIVDQRATPYRHMQVWDTHSKAKISFEAIEYAQAQLGWIIENNLIVSAMQERLKHNYNVRLHFGTAIENIETANGAISLITSSRGPSIQSKLIIAADGGESKIRSLSGIETKQESFDQDALVATVQCEKHHGYSALQCFTPTGPVAMLPMHDNYCSLVWSCDRVQSDNLMSLNNLAFSNELEKLFVERLGRLRVLDNPMRFPLHNRHANTYIADRIALVGDAAHVTHPLAGLGANIGMLDAAALAETICNALDQGKSLGSQSVLRRYERWRKGENRLVLSAMKAFKNVFGSTDPGLRQLRQSGFLLADTVAPLKRELAAHAMGLSGDLPKVCRSVAPAQAQF